MYIYYVYIYMCVCHPEDGWNVQHIFEARNLDAFCNETIWVTEIIHCESTCPKCI